MEGIEVGAVVGVGVAEQQGVDAGEVHRPLELGEGAVAGVEPELRRAVLEEEAGAGIAGGRIAAGAAEDA